MSAAASGSVGVRPELSIPQRRALDALVATGNLNDAAQAAGVTGRTLRRWRQTGAWRMAYRTAVREVADGATGELLALSVEATAVLRSTLRSGTEAEKARCARYVVDTMLAIGDDDIAQRLDELEEAVKARWSEDDSRRPGLTIA